MDEEGDTIRGRLQRVRAWRARGGWRDGLVPSGRARVVELVGLHPPHPHRGHVGPLALVHLAGQFLGFTDLAFLPLPLVALVLALAWNRPLALEATLFAALLSQYLAG